MTLYDCHANVDTLIIIIQYHRFKCIAFDKYILGVGKKHKTNLVIKLFYLCLFQYGIL